MSDLKTQPTMPTSSGGGTYNISVGLANTVDLVTQAFGKLTLAMHYIAGTVLVSMMFITLADVISRAIFGMTEGAVDFTFIGGIELTKYGLLTVVLFSLPHAVGRSQVIVDLFTEKWSNRVKNLVEAFYMFGFTLIGSGMSYRFYHAIEYANDSGETTQDLFIPLSYLYGLSAFATSVLAIAALLTATNLILNNGQERVS